MKKRIVYDREPGHPAAQIAHFAKAGAQKKIPELMAALEEHQMSDHHRLMIRLSLEHMRFLEEQLTAIDEWSQRKIQAAGYEKQWELPRTLPAVRENAAAVLAEMGPDPRPFPNEKHLGLVGWSVPRPQSQRRAQQEHAYQ